MVISNIETVSLTRTVSSKAVEWGVDPLLTANRLWPATV